MAETALVYGYQLSGDDKGKAISLSTRLDRSECYWIHLDYSVAETRSWLEAHDEIDDIVESFLLSEDPRPRATLHRDGIMVSLRGINFSDDSAPEDMVTIRLWITENTVVSTRRRRLLSAAALADLIANGQGPESPAELICEIAEKLLSRMRETLSDLLDDIDEIEEQYAEGDAKTLRDQLGDCRRKTIVFKRYLSPQRDALKSLFELSKGRFTPEESERIREQVEVVSRYVEDLDAARDRAAVMSEQIVGRLSDELNRRMYALSIVAAVFLPLGFLTGLLGINVAGLPGADSEWAFIIVCAGLSVIVALQIWLFKKRGWF
ncbi:MAG: zinc transporter ZntB [Gammaproteobacteria bacterium]|nr:zinc transporter ZntB [Gammaproteobacteria bacterium]